MAFDGIICYRRNDESGIPSGVYVARLIQENLQKNGLKPYLDVEDGELFRRYEDKPFEILEKTGDYCVFILAPYTFNDKRDIDDDVLKELRIAYDRQQKCDDHFVFAPVNVDDRFKYEENLNNKDVDKELKVFLNKVQAYSLSINTPNFHFNIEKLANHIKSHIKENKERESLYSITSEYYYSNRSTAEITQTFVIQIPMIDTSLF